MRSETSFELDGDLIVVDAIIVGPAGRALVQLVLDTGAVLTTLTPAIAAQLGYREATALKRTVTRTATAAEPGYLVQLLELTTLGVTTPSVHANIANLGYGVDGLLGMNFLLDFNLEIRPAQRRILVERIAPS